MVEVVYRFLLDNKRRREMNVNFDYLIYHAVIGSTPKKFGQYINEKKKRMRGKAKWTH